jgi:hypothetical protein
VDGDAPPRHLTLNTYKLRTLISNGDFDQYWIWHLTQEQQRIHNSRYLAGVNTTVNDDLRRAAPYSEWLIPRAVGLQAGNGA